MNIKKFFSLHGRVAIITGGAGMLGLEYARALSEAGARVVLFDVRSNPRAQRFDYAEVDITKKSEVAKALKAVIKKYGRVDVLINNAAMNPVPGSRESAMQFSPYERYPIDLWERELSVGLTGMLLCSQAVIPIMKKQKSGSIINVSSTYGLVAPDNRIYDRGKFKSIGYATAKGAVPNFTRSMASYLRGTSIRVNTLTPGGVFAGHSRDFVKRYSDRTLMGRMAKRDEYNGAVLFLASDASSYMTGANLVVDGGWTSW